MDADRDQVHERALEEATDWLIRLQDAPDDRDLLRRFDAWLAVGPCNAAAWAETGHALGLIARTPPAFADRWRVSLAAHRAECLPVPGSAPRPGGSKIRARLRQSGGARRRGVAVAVVVSLLAFMVTPDLVRCLRADYVTGTGEIRTIGLADGSTVALAPGSAIHVAYGKGERRIDLLSGEAFFNVVHDPTTPFRVDAEDVETTDLGTAFDMRRGDDGVSITVRQGRVQVDYRRPSPPVSETLEARQTLHLAWNGAPARGEELPSQIAAWRDYQLIAQDEPIREVVDRLRPYFAGVIIVANAALENQPVTGVYNLADPIEALRGIAQAHGASVSRISPWILVVSGG